MVFNMVENFISIFDDRYVILKFFFEFFKFDWLILFGIEMWKYFLLDLDNWMFLNYGVFGCVLKEGLEIVYKW